MLRREKREKEWRSNLLGKKGIKINGREREGGREEVKYEKKENKESRWLLRKRKTQVMTSKNTMKYKKVGNRQKRKQKQRKYKKEEAM